MGSVQAGQLLHSLFFLMLADRMSHPKVMWHQSSLCIPLCNYTHPHCWVEIQVTKYTNISACHEGYLLKLLQGAQAALWGKGYSSQSPSSNCNMNHINIVYSHRPFINIRLSTIITLTLPNQRVHWIEGDSIRIYQTCACHLESGML